MSAVHDLKFTKRAKSFVLFDELSETDTKEWLVKGWLGAGEASASYGKPGAAKSALAEDMGLHIASGWTWHGRKVKQGAVVYVALERHKLVERRAVAFRLKHDIESAPFAIVSGVYDCRDPQTALQLAEIVGEVERTTGEKVVLIIIDTLSRALCGGDENAPKDMGAIVNTTSILQERTGAHVHWLHHTPIDGVDRMRGHSAILGAMDTTVLVAKEGGARIATVMKANDSDEGEQIVFGLDSVVIGHNAEGDATTAPVVRPISDAPANYRSEPNAKLSKSAQIALTALSEAINDQGEVAEGSNQIPAGVRVVGIDTWRQQAYGRGISASNEARARQQAFQRAVESLLTKRKVGAWQDKYWVAA